LLETFLLQTHFFGRVSLTIIVLFHTGCFINFKHFYIGYVQKHMKDEFPNTVSYNRFTELIQSNLLPLTMFLKVLQILVNQLGVDFTGLNFIY
jgi:hypothetical protein